MADLLEVTKGRATLLITHELRGLHWVDQIVVLEAGKIAGRGNPRRATTGMPALPADVDRRTVARRRLLGGGEPGRAAGVHHLRLRWMAHEGNPPAGGMPCGRVAAIVLNIRVSAKSRMGPWREEKAMRAAAW
jgi:hypothetical protein